MKIKNMKNNYQYKLPQKIIPNAVIICYIYTVEARFNVLRYNDIPGITINIRLPRKSYSKMYGAEPRYNDLRCPGLRGSYRGGLWHGSRAEKTTNHESRISKFHFPESRKSARKTLLSCECLKIQQNREKKKKDCK